MILIKAYLSLVNCFVLVSGSSTKWAKSNISVEAKSSLTISCTATNVDFMGIVKIEHSPPGRNTSTFAVNGLLKPPYESQNRHLIDYQRNKTSNSSTLHITFKETQSSDSGIYSCQNLQSIQEEPDQFKLTVLVPIKEAYVALIDLENFDSIRNLQRTDDSSFHSDFFSKLQPLENGTSVEVEEGLGLVCFATSDGDGFKIEATLDDQVIGRDRFHVENLEKSLKTDDGPRETTKPSDEKLEKHHAWKAIVVTEVDRMFNNKTFTCAATAQFLPPVTAFGIITVEYAPVINCKQHKHVVEMEKKVYISCSVFANPAAEITWMEGQNLLNSSDIKLNEQVVAKDESEVSMTIDRVESRHLRSYLIQASNHLGNSSFTLTLSKKPGTRAHSVSPSSSSSSSSSNERIVAAFGSSLSVQAEHSVNLGVLVTSMTVYLSILSS